MKANLIVEVLLLVLASHFSRAQGFNSSSTANQTYQQLPKGKILLYPYGPCYHSGVFHMERIASLLTTEGYNVTMLVSSNYKSKSLINQQAVNFMVFYAPPTNLSTACDFGPEQMKVQGVSKMVKLINTLAASSAELCESLLQSSLLKDLSLDDIDLLIVDTFDYCSVIVAEAIGIPFMTMTTQTVPLTYDELARYSRNPFVMQKSGYPMTFSERLSSLAQYCSAFFMSRYSVLPKFHELKVKYNIRPESDASSVYEKAVLSLRRTDRRIDYPRPTYVHELEVAFMFPSLVVQKLDDKILKFIGDDQIVMISFGSLAKNLPQDRRKVFADALAMLKIKVVWKVENLNDAPSNIMPLPWIPQSELLASGRVRLLITHGGGGSTSEAVYYGVPMIITPLYGDQPTMAHKMENFLKVAKMLDMDSLTSDELVATISDLWDERSDVRLRAEILGSQIRNDPDQPRDKFLYWVNEFVSRKGVDLELVKPKRPASVNLFQWLSIDVVLFVAVLLALGSWIIIYLSIKLVYKLVSLIQ